MKQTLNLEQKTSKFVALSEQELRETEGGIIGWITLAIVAIIAIGCATDGDPETVTRVNGHRVGN